MPEAGAVELRARLTSRRDLKLATVARLRGQHTPRIFDQGTLPSGAPFMVMELLDGEDLGARLRRVRRLSPRELASVLNLSPASITVAPNSADHLRNITPDPAVIKRLGLTTRPYFVALGNLTPNKNLAVAIRALSRLANPAVRLVLIGDRPAVFDRSAFPADPRVIFTGRRSDAEIAALLGGDGWDSAKLFEIGGKAIEGSYFSNHYSPDDPSPRIQEFVKAYQARFGSVPDGLAANHPPAVLTLIPSSGAPSGEAVTARTSPSPASVSLAKSPGCTFRSRAFVSGVAPCSTRL